MQLIPGIDVSKWQGEINWELVKEQGIVWACARMGIGTTYKDPYWVENITNARDAGIVIGGYYVPDFRITSSGGLINNLENILETAGTPDFLVNDVEKFGLPPYDHNNHNQIAKEISEYMDGIVNGRVLQYSSKSIWDDKLRAMDWASQYRLWVAHYRAAPGQDWRAYLNPSNMPSIPVAWVPGAVSNSGPHTGWRIWQVIDSALNFQGVQSNEIDINLWKADDFYGMFPGAIPDPDPEPDPEPDPDPEPTPGEPWGF
jgi:GH25 family lysozyme M1 (1,4-beta-N-acetylmuramidase)